MKTPAGFGFLFSLMMFPVAAPAQPAETQSVVIIPKPSAEFQGKHLEPSDLLNPVFDHQNVSGNLFDGISSKPGFGFLSSAVLPGLGQAANKNWIKAGIFAAVEAASIWLIADLNNSAKRGERRYKNWADSNWSVVSYSKWLVDYHEANQINNPFIGELKEMVENTEAAYNPEKDWDAVDLTILRNVERNTPFFSPDRGQTNLFSHVLPDYGSQQYYELIAKYYQFQGGWKDFHSFHDELGHPAVKQQNNPRYLIDNRGTLASPFFYEGSGIAEQFNRDYRRSGYFTALLIANHIISAFDAYFTIKLKQNRLKVTSSGIPGRQFHIVYRF